MFAYVSGSLINVFQLQLISKNVFFSWPLFFIYYTLLFIFYISHGLCKLRLICTLCGCLHATTFFIYPRNTCAKLDIGPNATLPPFPPLASLILASIIRPQYSITYTIQISLTVSTFNKVTTHIKFISKYHDQ